MAGRRYTNSLEFTNHADYVVKLNGHTIWWKHSTAKKDASRFVVITEGEQRNTPSEDLLQAVAHCMQSPNPLVKCYTKRKQKEYLTELSPEQKKLIKKKLRMFDSQAKLSDLQNYL